VDPVLESDKDATEATPPKEIIHVSTGNAQLTVAGEVIYPDLLSVKYKLPTGTTVVVGIGVVVVVVVEVVVVVVVDVVVGPL